MLQMQPSSETKDQAGSDSTVPSSNCSFLLNLSWNLLVLSFEVTTEIFCILVPTALANSPSDYLSFK